MSGFYTNDFKELCKEVIRVQGSKTCLISFSGGKDSIALFLRCWESGMFDKFILFHYYLIPELSWVDEYIDYLQRKFKGIKIIQVPNPTLVDLLNSHILQTPFSVQATENFYHNKQELPSYDLSMLQDEIIFCENLPKNTLCGVGVKSADSSLRRLSLKKHGLITFSKKKWYPIHDFKNQDIKDIIKKHNVKYPEDYNLFGMSFDGIDYKFLKVIKEKKPEDYKRIKEIFPLCDLIIHKREHYFGTEIKRSKFKITSDEIL